MRGVCGDAHPASDAAGKPWNDRAQRPLPRASCWVTLKMKSRCSQQRDSLSSRSGRLRPRQATLGNVWGHLRPSRFGVLLASGGQGYCPTPHKAQDAPGKRSSPVISRAEGAPGLRHVPMQRPVSVKGVPCFGPPRSEGVAGWAAAPDVAPRHQLLAHATNPQCPGKS